MKVWYEKDTVYFDTLPAWYADNISDAKHWIQLDTDIDRLVFDGKHVYIKGTPHDAIIHDIDNPLICTVRYKAKTIEEMFSEVN